MRSSLTTSYPSNVGALIRSSSRVDHERDVEPIGRGDLEARAQLGPVGDEAIELLLPFVLFGLPPYLVGVALGLAGTQRAIPRARERLGGVAEPPPVERAGQRQPPL